LNPGGVPEKGCAATNCWFLLKDFTMKIALTGHRPNKLGYDYALISPLAKALEERLQQIVDIYKPEAMISGMALGADMLWAKLAIRNGVALHAYIPFEGQENKWPLKSREQYWEVLSHASLKMYVSKPGYAAYKMQVRNIHMVNDCDLLVAVWDGSGGGTANCVGYAKSREKKIITINPKHIHL